MEAPLGPAGDAPGSPGVLAPGGPPPWLRGRGAAGAPRRPARWRSVSAAARAGFTMRAVGPRDLSLRSRRTVTPGGMEGAVVVVRAGRIADVLPPRDAAARGAEDLGERVLMPGLVDTHVHVNEPGRTEW